MALCDQRVVLVGEGPVAGVDVAGAALYFAGVDKPGLVEVREAPSFRPVGVDLPVEAGGEEDLGGARGRHGCVRNENIEGVSSDVPFRAALLLSVETSAGVVGAPVAAVNFPGFCHYFCSRRRHDRHPGAPGGTGATPRRLRAVCGGSKWNCPG